MVYVPESSKRLKFEPPNRQKTDRGLKLDTLGPLEGLDTFISLIFIGIFACTCLIFMVHCYMHVNVGTGRM